MPDKPIELEDGWQNYADPECESCEGNGLVTGMGAQSKVIIPCHDCWPNREE